MIFPVMKTRFPVPVSLATALTMLCFTLPALAQKKPKELEKPLAGPRATVLRVTEIYVAPDLGSQKIDRVQIGREMVLAEKNGPWMRVYANTDIEELNEKDTPVFDSARQSTTGFGLD